MPITQPIEIKRPIADRSNDSFSNTPPGPTTKSPNWLFMSDLIRRCNKVPVKPVGSAPNIR